MNGDDKNFLDKRLTILETKFQERWEAHDKFAIDRNKGMCKRLDALKNQIEIMFTRKDTCMKESKGYANKLVALSLGIPATVLLVLKIMEHVAR